MGESISNIAVLASHQNETVFTQQALDEFEAEWKEPNRRLDLVPGKEALSFLNRNLQKKYQVSITPTGIIDAMKAEDVPPKMKRLLEKLKNFSSTDPGNRC